MASFAFAFLTILGVLSLGIATGLGIYLYHSSSHIPELKDLYQRQDEIKADPIQPPTVEAIPPEFKACPPARIYGILVDGKFFAHDPKEKKHKKKKKHLHKKKKKAKF